MARAEDEFIEAWVGLDRMLDRTQYSRLMEIYRREFQRLPHPVLGTGDHEPFSKIEKRISQVAIN